MLKFVVEFVTHVTLDGWDEMDGGLQLVTVSVATPLVTEPQALETKTLNILPLKLVPAFVTASVGVVEPIQ